MSRAPSNYNGDVSQKGSIISGNVNGNVTGMGCVIKGDVYGDVTGRGNVINGDIYGHLLGTGNVLKGDLYGTHGGTGNYIKGNNYTFQGAKPKPENIPVIGCGVNYGNVTNIFREATRISVGKTHNINGSIITCPNGTNVSIHDNDYITSDSGLVWINGDFEYKTPIYLSQILKGSEEPNAIIVKDINLSKTNTIIPQYDKEKDNVSTSDDEKMCTICMDNVKQCAMIPCGHGKFCIRCIHALVNASNTNMGEDKLLSCPTCKQTVRQVVRIYE